jgi:hypothetical protein
MTGLAATHRQAERGIIIIITIILALDITYMSPIITPHPITITTPAHIQICVVAQADIDRPSV